MESSTIYRINRIFTWLMLLLYVVYFRFLISRMFNYFIRCCRFYLCCILKKPVEKLAAMFRGSPAESKYILIKVIPESCTKQTAPVWAVKLYQISFRIADWSPSPSSYTSIPRSFFFNNTVSCSYQTPRARNFLHQRYGEKAICFFSNAKRCLESHLLVSSQGLTCWIRSSRYLMNRKRPGTLLSCSEYFTS